MRSGALNVRTSSSELADDHLLCYCVISESISSQSVRQRNLASAGTYSGGSQVFLGSRAGRSVSRVEFIIERTATTRNVQCVIKPSRTGMLLARFGEETTMKLIDLHAPTSATNADHNERFCERLDVAMLQKATYMIVIGSSNARLGK